MWQGCVCRLVDGAKLLLHTKNVRLIAIPSASASKAIIRFDHAGVARTAHPTAVVSRVLLTGGAVNVLERRAGAGDGGDALDGVADEALAADASATVVNVLAGPVVDGSGGAPLAATGAAQCSAAAARLPWHWAALTRHTGLRTAKD